MGKDNKTQVFDAGSDWDDFDHDDDDRDEKIGPITRARAPTRSTSEDNAMRYAEGVRRWQAFAQGGAVLDHYRRAGLIVRGKRPQKEAMPVEQNVVGPVEGTLINFDDDDDDDDDNNRQAEVPDMGEDEPAVQARGDLVTYDGAGDGLAEAMGEIQDTLPAQLDEDLMTFEEDGHSLAGGESPEQDPLPAAVEDDNNLAGGSSLADVLLTPSVVEDVISPAEGQLIELS